MLLNCYFFYKCLDDADDDKEDAWRWLCRIGVTITVTAAVLLIVGSVLSTQNGQYTCLNISSYVVVLEVCSSNICSVVDLEFWKGGFQYAIKVHVARLLGRSGGKPPYPENFLISDLLRSFLVYCWGEIAKVGRPTAKPSCLKPAELKAWLRFGPQRLVIRVRCGKISALILIAYRHP